ncbi:uncharacterized protein LOC128207209 [Mya arenaria]|uniref:uncharacterized protein LOC128207209 n=1 Tax=Mya arenaria TaxID=6604 RepID=UPI0022E31237|nr:uncharacterized protein LOC128207209 [Mya arenaria]
MFDQDMVPHGVALGMSISGLVCALVGLASPFWNVHVDGERWGLWRGCLPRGCQALWSTSVTDTLQAGRTLITIGLVGQILLTVLFVVFIVLKRDRRIIVGGIALSCVTACCSMFGPLLWLSSANLSVSWAFYVSYVSGILMAALGGVLLYIYKRDEV